jgi:hypothetical protein
VKGTPFVRVLTGLAVMLRAAAFTFAAEIALLVAVIWAACNPVPHPFTRKGRTIKESLVNQFDRFLILKNL